MFLCINIYVFIEEKVLVSLYKSKHFSVLYKYMCTWRCLRYLWSAKRFTLWKSATYLSLHAYIFTWITVLLTHLVMVFWSLPRDLVMEMLRYISNPEADKTGGRQCTLCGLILKEMLIGGGEETALNSVIPSAKNPLHSSLLSLYTLQVLTFDKASYSDISQIC